MYNRYIPQSDGTFRKSRLAEPEQGAAAASAESAPHFSDHPEPLKKVSSGIGIRSFFQNLLPADLDTEDLIIILLLLLISGNEGKDGNQAMLTLGAYLFL